MSKIDEHLDRLKAIFEELDVEAFATGSRIRGNHRPNSDLDIVVVAERSQEIDSIQLEKEIEERMSLQFSVDIDVCGKNDLINRMEQGDPRTLTLFNGMVSLTLEEDTKTQLLSAYPSTPPSTSNPYIKQIEEMNLATACMALVNAIIYDGYDKLVSEGELPVPPRSLPDRLQLYDREAAERVSRAIEVQNELRGYDRTPSDALPELIRLFEE